MDHAIAAALNGEPRTCGLEGSSTFGPFRSKDRQRCNRRERSAHRMVAVRF
jgi:hypothetical protein